MNWAVLGKEKPKLGFQFLIVWRRVWTNGSIKSPGFHSVHPCRISLPVLLSSPSSLYSSCPSVRLHRFLLAVRYIKTYVCSLRSWNFLKFGRKWKTHKLVVHQNVVTIVKNLFNFCCLFCETIVFQVEAFLKLLNQCKTQGEIMAEGSLAKKSHILKGPSLLGRRTSSGPVRSNPLALRTCGSVGSLNVFERSQSGTIKVRRIHYFILYFYFVITRWVRSWRRRWDR